MGRPKRVIRMGNSWSYGDAVALGRVLDAVLAGKNAAEIRELMRHRLASRAYARVNAMRLRGAAIAAGLPLPPPLQKIKDIDHLEPGFLPPETTDA